jgi:hypothetical protein
MVGRRMAQCSDDRLPITFKKRGGSVDRKRIHQRFPSLEKSVPLATFYTHIVVVAPIEIIVPGATQAWGAPPFRRVTGQKDPGYRKIKRVTDHRPEPDPL